MKVCAKTGFCKMILLFLFQYNLLAQNSLSIGPEISSRTKSFPVNGGLGFGGSLEYVCHKFKHGGIRSYAGYGWFAHRFPNIDPRVIQDSIAHMGINGYDVSILPIRIGYQHFLYKDAAYVYAEAGVSLMQTKYKSLNSNYSTNLFTYAIGSGYRFALSRPSMLQLSFSYNYNKLNKYSNRNYFCLRAAYGLIFNKVKNTVLPNDKKRP